MGEADDRKEIDLERHRSYIAALEGFGGERDRGMATPEGTPVNLQQFRSVYLGLSAGRGFKFPIIAGSDLAGQSWFGSYAILADGPRKFEGVSLASSREVVTLQSTGGIPVISISTKYFHPGEGLIYKIVFNTGTSYLPLSQSPIPAEPRVGDAGLLGVFAGSDATTVTVTWGLSAGCNGSSLLEIVYSVSGEQESANEVDRFLLDATGKPVSVALSASTMGTTVTLSGKRKEKGLLDGDDYP
jgi:hypothetical protein